MNYERPRQSAGCATRANVKGKGRGREKKERKKRKNTGRGNMVFNAFTFLSSSSSANFLYVRSRTYADAAYLNFQRNGAGFGHHRWYLRRTLKTHGRPSD